MTYNPPIPDNVNDVIGKYGFHLYQRGQLYPHSLLVHEDPTGTILWNRLKSLLQRDYTELEDLRKAKLNLHPVMKWCGRHELLLYDPFICWGCVEEGNTPVWRTHPMLAMYQSSRKGHPYAL